MFSIEDWLIWSWHGWVPKWVTIRSKTFHTRFKKVLVVWKSKIQCIDLWVFWDGMEILILNPKPFMVQPVRQEILVQALQIYREYDEENNRHVAYAYHFPKDQELIDQVNELLSDDTALQIHNKFVKVISTQEPKDPSWLAVSLKHNWKRWVLSYLYWLSLLYGTWIGEWASMEIRFPFSWSVIAYEPVFDWIKSWLGIQWYDVDWNVLNSDMWQVQSIHIYDRAVLEQFAVWQWVEESLPGRERAIRYKSKLLEYLKMEETPWNTIQTITNWLLKLRKK